MRILSPFERQFYKSVTICELPFLYPTKIGQGLLVKLNEGNEKAYLEHLNTLPKVVVNKPGGLIIEEAPPFTQDGYTAWIKANQKSAAVHRAMVDAFLVPDGHETRGAEVFDFMPPEVFGEISDFLLSSLGETTPAGKQSPATSGNSTKKKTPAKVLKAP